MTPIEALQKTAEILEQDGWAKNSFGYMGGPKCLLGGVQAAIFGTLNVYEIAFKPQEQQRLYRKCRGLLYDAVNCQEITGWNDARLTRKHHVFKAIDRAIHLATLEIEAAKA